MKLEKRITVIALSGLLLFSAFPELTYAEVNHNVKGSSSTPMEIAIAQGNQSSSTDGITYDQPFIPKMWKFATMGPNAVGEIKKEEGDIKLLQSGFDKDNRSMASAYLKNTIHLQDDLQFSAKFVFSMPKAGYEGTLSTDKGGDGIAFVINASTNEMQGDGSGMGYQGITKSIAIECDAWKNSNPGETDPSDNHIAITTRGKQFEHHDCKDCDYNFNDGNKYTVWVDYKEGKLSASIRQGDNCSDKPTEADVSYSLSVTDMKTILGTEDVYVGFSAAEWYAYADHIIHGVYFKNTYTDSIPIDAKQSIITEADLPGFTVTKKENESVIAKPGDYFGELRDGEQYIFYEKDTEVKVPIANGTSYTVLSTMNDDGKQYEYAILNAAGLQTAKRGTITVRVLKDDEAALTYNANGGSGDTAAVVGTIDFTVTVSENKFTAPANCEFIGWNTSKDGSGTAYAAGDEYTLEGTGNMLYAQWSRKSESVTDDGNAETEKKDEILTEETNNESENTEASLTEEANTEDSIAEEANTEDSIAEDAKSESAKKKVSLTYVANNGSKKKKKVTKKIDSKVILAENGFKAPANCEFNGWNTKKDGTGKAYAPGEKYKLKIGKNVLYAQWIKKEVSLTYDANTGSGSMEETVGRIDERVTVATNRFTAPSEYEFNGWNTKADGTGKAYKDGKTYTLEANGNVLYAQWVKKDGGINYDANSGSGSGSTSTDEARINPPETGDMNRKEVYAEWAFLIGLMLVVLANLKLIIGKKKNM